ncbi:MAG: SMC-Scp complex subunit ScpB [Thermoplasmata archaeon]|nr:SMC-Scp complex subunit ScpB [Thermoplasmata archaeon]
MSVKVDDLALKVEALLFAAGHPLSVRELGETLRIEDPHALQEALRTLQKTYGSRQTAIELAHVGERYTLQLREAFLDTARAVTPMELGPRAIKALTLIAYHQPMLQSQLVKMIGESAYEEVGHLRSFGLIRTESKGSTLELETTRAFAEYFGLPSTRPDEIRRILERKLGVSSPAATDLGPSSEPAPAPSEDATSDPTVADPPTP